MPSADVQMASPCRAMCGQARRLYTSSRWASSRSLLIMTRTCSGCQVVAVVARWLQCGCQVVAVVARWLQCGCQVVAMWLPGGCNVVAMWLPGGCSVVARWLQCGCQVVAVVARWLQRTKQGQVKVESGGHRACPLSHAACLRELVQCLSRSHCCGCGLLVPTWAPRGRRS